MPIVLGFAHFLVIHIFLQIAYMSFDVPPNNFIKFYVKFQVEQFFVLGLGPKLSDNLFGAGLEVEALA